MRIKSLELLVVVSLLMALMLFSFGCGGEGADDDTTDDDATDDDATDDDTDDDADDDITWEGDETVYVQMRDEEPIEVELNGLPAFLWHDPEDNTDKQAILLKTVVDTAKPNCNERFYFKYNFIATDGYNVLNQKLDGDYRDLPGYDELEMGWFVQYEEEGKYKDIKIVWDEDLGYPKFMGVRMMNGGTIQGVENILYDKHVTVNVGYATTKSYTAVDLYGLPAFESEDGLSVYLHHIIWEANLANFDPKTKDYAFNFIGNDGFNLLVDKLGGDLGLLPVWQDFENSKDVHHGWIYDAGETDGYRINWDAVTGFANYYKVKHMDNGYIEVYDVTP